MGKFAGAALGIAGMLAVSNSASADSSGSVGRVVAVEINSEGSDSLGNFRGAVDVLTPPRSGSPARTTRYFWGGSNCRNRNLSGRSVQVLTAAMTSNLKIAPRYKAGQIPNSRCLVGFKVKRGGGGHQSS